MSELDDEADRNLLRRIGRRNTVRVLPVAGLALLFWWFATHWLQRRFELDAHLAMYSAMAVTIGVVLLLIRLLGIDRRRPDPLVTPRIRWLQDQKLERIRVWQRRVWIVILTFELFLGLLAFPFARSDGSVASISGSWALVSPAVLILMCDRDGLFWPLSVLPQDPSRRMRALIAARHGYLTLLILGLAVLVVDSYRPGSLSASLPLVVVVGLLVPQISMAVQDQNVDPAMTGSGQAPQ